MRQVTYARYYLRGLPGKKPHASRWKMSPEDAAAAGALGVVPGTEEIRGVPDTDAERGRAIAFYPSAGHDGVQPPKRQNGAMLTSSDITKPGRYHFHDAIGAPAQELHVVDDGGVLVARFPPADGDPGADLPISDLAGHFEPLP